MPDFDPVAYLTEPRWSDINLGLERMTLLMERLGDPIDTLPVIHVAGTNGKGSTCAFIEAALRAQGYRTGLYTSPSIVTFNDRIRIDGVPIGDELLRRVTLRVREVADAMDDHPTEFELMTAVGALAFAEAGVDVVVYEVGLGGRFDATNTVKAPLVCAIAPISIDHVNLLGSTLSQIAFEKAGIIKPGATVVSAPQQPEALEVLERACAEAGCELRQAPAEGLGTPEDFTFGRLTHARLGLVGSYQPQNAALALLALEAASEKGFPVSDESLARAFEQVEWPGRFERLGDAPTFIVDGGHNLQGAQVLVESLARSYPGRKPLYVIGVLEDKDYAGMLETLLPGAAGFVCYAPRSPRALPAAKLARALRWTAQDIMGCAGNCMPMYEAASVPEALERAFALAGEDGLVVACGTLYSIGEIKQAYAKLREAPRA